jgi:hypothetical protein
MLACQQVGSAKTLQWFYLKTFLLFWVNKSRKLISVFTTAKNSVPFDRGEHTEGEGAVGQA